MPKHLPQSLTDYFSKKKNSQNSSQLSSLSFSRMLSGCRHPKTLSFAEQNIDDDAAAATLSDVDRFLFENFRSLYIRDDDCTESNHKADKVKVPPQSPESSDTLFETPNLCGSNRVLLVRGSSGSLSEETQPTKSLTATSTLASASTLASTSASASTSTSTSASASTSTSTSGKAWRKVSSEGEECIAVLRCSRNPQEDFRRSMQEMVEVRVEEDGKVDWDFVEELLFCYLNMNEKKSYKFILGAFVDVVTSLRQNGDVFDKERFLVPREGGMGRRAGENVDT